MNGMKITKVSNQACMTSPQYLSDAVQNPQYISVDSARLMWLSVLVHTVREFKAKIDAAKKGKKRLLFEADYYAIRSVEEELADAMDYFTSEDCEAVAGFANIKVDLDLIRELLLSEERIVYGTSKNRVGRQTMKSLQCKEARDRVAAQVLELRAKGMSAERIGERINFSRRTVMKILEENGLT